MIRREREREKDKERYILSKKNKASPLILVVSSCVPLSDLDAKQALVNTPIRSKRKKV